MLCAFFSRRLPWRSRQRFRMPSVPFSRWPRSRPRRRHLIEEISTCLTPWMKSAWRSRRIAQPLRQSGRLHNPTSPCEPVRPRRTDQSGWRGRERAPARISPVLKSGKPPDHQRPCDAGAGGGLGAGGQKERQKNRIRSAESNTSAPCLRSAETHGRRTIEPYSTPSSALMIP